MSSLRLALKQSLQESGGGPPEKRKQKKRPPGQQQQQRRKRRPGDPPRKRGRPRKHPLPEDVPVGGVHNESAKESSDEENEFSDSMASLEHDDDDDDDDEERREDDADDDGTTNNEGGEKEQHSQKQPEQEAQQQQSRERASGDDDEEEQLRLARKKRKRLLKKLKRESAANTIQNQWKKKKAGKLPDSNNDTNANRGRPVSPKPPKKQEEQEQQPRQKPDAAEESESATPATTPESTPKPKKAINKTVPPPAVEIIGWIGEMSVKQQRRNMSAGLRVKVRFATKVKKRDGKIVRKHKWYGGLVTAMSSGGSKIRIKYDDGTSEVAKYPDKDIIVDDEGNGAHQVVADVFMPPSAESDDNANNKDPSLNLVDSPERNKKTKKISTDVQKPSGRDSPDDDWKSEENRAKSNARADTPQREHEHEMTDDTNDGNISEGVAPAEGKPVEETTAEANPSTDEVTGEEEAKPVKVPATTPAEEDVEMNDEERRSKSTKPTNISQRERDFSNSSAGSDSKPLDDNDDDNVDSRMDKDMDDEDDDDSSDDDGAMEIIAQGTGGEVVAPAPPVAPEVSEVAAAKEDDVNVVVAIDEDKTTKNVEDKEEAMLQLDDEPATIAAVGDDDEEEAHPKRADLKEEGKTFEEAQNTEDAPIAKEEEKQVQPEKDDVDTGKFVPVVEEEQQGGEDAVMDDADEAPKVEDENDGAILSNEPSEARTKAHKRKRESSPKVSRSNTPVLKLAKHETPPGSMLTEFKNDAPDTVVAKPISTMAKSMSLDVDEAPAPQEAEPRNVESAQILSSERSAFDKSNKMPLQEKKEKQPPVQQVSNEDTRPLTPTHDKTDLSNIQRSGRRAAQQANERIASRQELVIQDAFTKPKKKKGDKPEGKNATVRDRKRKEPEGGIDITDDDNQWVQCDTCSKWRVLPSTVDVDQLPNQWHCEMNIYDPLHNVCNAAEQTPEDIAKAKRKAKRRQARRARQEAAATTTVSGEETEVKEMKPARRAKSPMPEPEKRDSKPKKEEKRPEEGKKLSSPTIASDEEGVNSSASNSGSDLIKEAKKARRSRSQEEEAESVEAPKGKPRGRRRGKDVKDKEGKGGKGSKGVEDNQEWVQCEKCEKWRRLPPQIKASDLPDVWYCSMNTWDTSTNTCSAAEDKADPNTVAVGGFGGHGGHKLSYRSLIFGTGKKQSRPISERTRAAESLFSPYAYGDEVGSNQRVMYANSSMFVSKSRTSEEAEAGKISFLDLMSQSNLWAELRGLGKRLNDPGIQPTTRLCSLGTDLAHSSLPDDLKHEMKELVYHALGGSTMASHEVLLEAQCRPWEGVPKAWTELKAACTVDSVVECLLELVSDGRVEVAPATGSEVSVLEAMPKFRRVVKAPQVPQLQPEEEEAVSLPSKASRCMKFSKPWKRNFGMKT